MKQLTNLPMPKRLRASRQQNTDSKTLAKTLTRNLKFNKPASSRQANKTLLNNSAKADKQKGNSTMKTKNLFNFGIKSFMILLFTALLISFQAKAQVSSTWTSRYNGPGTGYDVAASVVTNAAGEVFVTGSSMGTSSTGLDYCTIKYGPDGLPSPTWPDMGSGVGVRRYDGPVHGFDEAHKIAINPATGVVYVTGYITNTSATGIDWCTLMYSPTGMLMGVAIYNGTAGAGHDFPYDIFVDATGNVYVAGSSTNDPSHIDYHDMTVIRYTPALAPMWIKTYDGPAHVEDIATSVKADALGNVYVTGYADFGPVEHINFVTLKFTAGGLPSTTWPSVGLGFGVRKYNNPVLMNNDYAYDMVVDASRNVFVTGVTVASGVKDYATLRYTESGVEAWVNIYSGPALDDIPSAIALTPAGNVVVTGKSDQPGFPDFAYRTIQYSSTGTEMWVATYSGPGYTDPITFITYNDDEPTALVVDGSGNIYVTGYSLGPTHYDYATVRYSPSGVQEWVMRYNGLWGFANDRANAIALTSTGNVVVTGFSSNYSVGGPATYDYLTILYTQTLTGISGNENETPNKFELKQNYPNPFNPSTKISFKIADIGNVSLKVYDISGKEVATLINKQMNAGNYEVTFDANKLSSGVYFYKLVTNSFSDTKRMMLIK